jgi:hypothetical protein
MIKVEIKCQNGKNWYREARFDNKNQCIQRILLGMSATPQTNIIQNLHNVNLIFQQSRIKQHQWKILNISKKKVISSNKANQWLIKQNQLQAYWKDLIALIERVQLLIYLINKKLNGVILLITKMMRFVQINNYLKKISNCRKWIIWMFIHQWQKEVIKRIKKKKKKKRN